MNLNRDIADTERLFREAFSALKTETEDFAKAKINYQNEETQLKDFKKKLDSCIQVYLYIYPISVVFIDIGAFVNICICSSK